MAAVVSPTSSCFSSPVSSRCSSPKLEVDVNDGSDFIARARNFKTVKEFDLWFRSKHFQNQLKEMEKLLFETKGSASIEDICRRWARQLRFSRPGLPAYGINQCRKSCKFLVECLCDVYSDKLIRKFGLDNIARILKVVLPLDRANCLYNMIYEAAPYRFGMHWVAKKHLNNQYWKKIVDSADGFPTISKRLLVLCEKYEGLREDVGHLLLPIQAEFEGRVEAEEQEHEDDGTVGQDFSQSLRAKTLRAMAELKTKNGTTPSNYLDLYKGDPGFQMCFNNCQRALKMCIGTNINCENADKVFYGEVDTLCEYLIRYNTREGGIRDNEPMLESKWDAKSLYKDFEVCHALFIGLHENYFEEPQELEKNFKGGHFRNLLQVCIRVLKAKLRLGDPSCQETIQDCLDWLQDEQVDLEISNSLASEASES